MWQLPPLTSDEILIYLRKSRADDPLLTVNEVLAKHEQMLDDWVARNLPDIGKVPEKNRFREVVSGETLESRPRINKMLRKAESAQYKAVLVVEPQRLSRGDLEDIGRLVKLLRYSNTIVITLQYTYDLRDERDRDMFERELKRGNEFLEYQKRILWNGRLLSVSNGNYLGNTAPYGYKKVQLKEGKKTCYTLEPIPEQAEGVKLIFKLYLEGMGKRRIADYLDQMGVPTQNGGAWPVATIDDILLNEHYLGKVVWNKRPRVRTVQDGEVVSSRPAAEEYLVFEGKHPAIIDQETWDAAVAKRGAVPRVKRNLTLQNPLAGLLYCQKCGSSMARKTYKGNDGNQRCRDRYECRNQGKCDGSSAAIDDVMADVVKALKKAIEDFEVRIKMGNDDSVAIHKAMVERLEKRLKELQELEIAQWEEKTKGGMPAHVFERLNGNTLREIEEVQQNLCTAREAIPEPIDLQHKLSNFKAALASLSDKKKTVREKNALLKDCIERIEYYRPRVNNGRAPRADQEAPIQLTFRFKL